MQKTSEFSFTLKPSTIPEAGIGVFVVHPVAAGVRLKVLPDGFQSRRLRRKDIPDAFMRHCIAKEGGWYLCPPMFNRMEIGWYMNHSTEPNTEVRDDGYYALRDLQEGEEILIDYNQLGEPEAQKEAYYKRL